MTQDGAKGPKLPDAEAIAAGHAIYTPKTLKAYDLIVHGLSNRYAWQCATEEIDALYRQNLTGNHLEAGAGTGLFLLRANPPAFDRLTLLDINASCLDMASERLAHYQPERLQASLFEPLPPSPPYQSVALTYVLHCLPGGMEEKLQVVDRLADVMAEDGVLFGATILGEGISPNIPARLLLGFYNRRGVFDNRADSLADLAEGLRSRFRNVSVSRRGCVALFRASGREG